MSTYIIPAVSKNEIAKKLDKLAKKAAAYKCNFSYTFGNETAVTRNVYTVCDNVKTRTGSETVFGIELTIDSDIIRKNGYRIIIDYAYIPAASLENALVEFSKTMPKDVYNFVWMFGKIGSAPYIFTDNGTRITGFECY